MNRMQWASALGAHLGIQASGHDQRAQKMQRWARKHRAGTRICGKCQGTGGAMLLQCGVCGGSGKLPVYICPKCGGKGKGLIFICSLCEGYQRVAGWQNLKTYFGCL